MEPLHAVALVVALAVLAACAFVEVLGFSRLVSSFARLFFGRR